MAWRDTRTSRGRLLLFSSSIILGVAALAAIGSLGTNLDDTLELSLKIRVTAPLSSTRSLSCSRRRIWTRP